jgi:hypothetical protein
MGGIAEAMAAYAQPLLDQTDGSTQQMNSAFALGPLCWNLALLPEQARDEALAKMRPTLKMDDDQFETFRRSVVVPMIQVTRRCSRACTGWVQRDLPEGHPRPKRAGQRRRVLKSSRGPGTMRRVPVKVGESTSCVADDDPITVVAMSRRETKYGTHAVACALGVLQPLGELQTQGAPLPNQ